MSLRVIITNFNLWLTQLPFWSKYSHSELLVACFSLTALVDNASEKYIYTRHV